MLDFIDYVLQSDGFFFPVPALIIIGFLTHVIPLVAICSWAKHKVVETKQLPSRWLMVTAVFPREKCCFPIVIVLKPAVTDVM